MGREIDYTPLLLAPAVRRLAIGLRINGQVVPGLIRFAVQSNNYWSADTFTAEVALDASSSWGPPFWALNDTIEVELLASLDPAQQPTSLILGLVDSLEWASDQPIRVSGRDYSGVLIDARTSEKFANQTSSSIAQTLAARHSLQASVQPTTTLAGDYYRADHVQMTDRITEWQLLTYLAEREGFNLWVAGRVLYFQPAPSPAPPPLQIAYSYAGSDAPTQASTPRFTMLRNLTLARDIIVTVISWNHEQKAAIKAVAHQTKIRKASVNTPAQAPASKLPAQSFIFRVPGLTLAQAQDYADRKYAELSQHERKVTVSNLPMVLGLTARDMVQVVGTMTDFDQQYFIEEIERSFSATHATMTIRAKNASPTQVFEI
ncbi:MAG: hypothetical protein J0I21_11700 [Alphaproteobacteria bacterium]|nr:hypothetical protein [Alphaproteobacteria bacterium]